jgi:hypothetical protein
VLVRWDAPVPLWKNSAVSSIELKWIGNWCLDSKTIDDILNDQEKVNRLTIPALALVICTLANPAPKSANYEWIVNQGFRAEEFPARLQPILDCGFSLIENIPLSAPGFTTLALQAYGFRNGR